MDERLNFLDGLFVFDDVYLVDDDHHFFAPLSNPLQKSALALGEGAVHRSDKQNQIAAGNELLRDLFVFPDHRIGARRVDDIGLLQKRHRQRDGHQGGVFGLSVSLIAIPEKVYLMGGRRDSFDEEGLAQQGVDEGRFPGVELAHHDQ